MAYNAYIIVPLATWAVAQVAKFTIAGLKGDIDFKKLYASGGMPSVHSAVVTSLAVTALLIGGAASPIFGVTSVFAAIVIYDSLGVRRAVGNQAIAFNRLLYNLDNAKVRFDYSGLSVAEVRGHNPVEVVVGALLGLVLGGLLNYDHITIITAYFQGVPSQKGLMVYAGLFALMVLVGAIQNAVLRSRYSKSRAMQALIKKVLIMSQTIGWLGLLSVIFMYEKASYLSWRLWPQLLLVIGIGWGIGIYLSAYKTLPASLRQEANDARKHKWFAFGSNRNKKKR